MAIFKDAGELQAVLGGFFEAMRWSTDMGPRVREAHVLTTFVFSDPDLTVTIDAVNPPSEPDSYFNISYGQPPAGVPVTVTMSADNAHRFWQGKLNVLVAVMQKQIKIDGSETRMLALLPAVAPSFAMYRDYLKSIDRSDLLV